MSAEDARPARAMPTEPAHTVGSDAQAGGSPISISHAYDGPTLREVRESADVPLRRIARIAGISHGHLSKVERGEYGRPVTPAIVTAYEQATGVSLAEAVAGSPEREAGAGEPAGRQREPWSRGNPAWMRRRGYNAGIAALAMSGRLGEPYLRLIDGTGRPTTPASPGMADVEQLEQLTETLTAQDLRCGGGFVGHLAKALLRWAVPMLDSPDVDASVGRRLYAAVGALAHRAAWAAFDSGAQDKAMALFRLALYTASRADDPDLRAYVLADIAAQHNYRGYQEHALEVVRIIEGDERVAPLVRMVIQGVKARAFVGLRDAEACRRCVEAAERHHQEADWPIPKDWHWVQSLCHPRHLNALTGHAFAELATTSCGSQADREEAIRRLTDAVDDFDPVSHARAHLLCATRLARLHLDTGDLAQGAYFGHLALRSEGQVRSARLAWELSLLRTTATSLGEEPAMRTLAEAIEDTERPSSPPRKEATQP